MARAGKGGSGRAGKGSGGGGASAGGIRAGGAFVELFTKDTALQKGLKAASAKVKSWSETVAKGGAGLVAGGTAILAPIIGLLTNAIGRAEKIGDVSEVFGLSAESASKMASAFEIAGGSIDELEKSLGKLALANVDGRPLDKFLLDTAKALNEIEDPSQRFKAASEIFGAKFARNFIDTGGDIAGLLGGAPMISAEQIASAKAFRMEWTTIGIVLQNSTLPLLKVMGPALQRVGAFVRENAGVIPIFAGIGAGIVASGVALLGFSAALKGVSIGLAGLAFLSSPIGLVTAAVVAGAAAWLTWSEDGRDAIGRVSESWNGIVAAISSGNLEAAFRVVTAGLNIEWIKFNMSMKQSFGFSLDNMKELLVGWAYFVKDVWADVSGFIAQIIANVGEAVGILPGGTGADLEATRKSEREARRAEAVAAAGKAATDHKARLAAAEAELKAAMAAAKAGAVPAAKLAAGKSPGSLGFGTSTTGAFQFGNAGQFFGGSSIAGQQLKQAEMQNKKLDEILAAFRGIPLARL